MTLTAQQLRLATGCSTPTADRFIEPINLTLDRFHINTTNRIAAFLAQCAHESSRFDRLTENLNYSAHGLAQTWPSRFRSDNGLPTELAQSLHRKPEEIANVVYAARLGNGDPASGDGWRFRGRGLIQVTGRYNYRECGRELVIDLEASPESLETPLYASLSAGWFWNMRGLNKWADEWSIERISRAINGGTHGMAERAVLSEQALSVLEAS